MEYYIFAALWILYYGGIFIFSLKMNAIWQKILPFYVEFSIAQMEMLDFYKNKIEEMKKDYEDRK